MNRSDKKADRYAFLGLSFSLPFFLANAIVSLRVEPLYSTFAAFPGIRNNPFFPLLLLVLFPVGAAIAALPMLPRKTGAKSRFILTNFVITFLLLGSFSVLSTALGWELYRCEVLRIPQCD